DESERGVQGHEAMGEHQGAGRDRLHRPDHSAPGEIESPPKRRLRLPPATPALGCVMAWGEAARRGKAPGFVRGRKPLHKRVIARLEEWNKRLTVAPLVHLLAP